MVSFRPQSRTSSEAITRHPALSREHWHAFRCSLPSRGADSAFQPSVALRPTGSWRGSRHAFPSRLSSPPVETLNSRRSSMRIVAFSWNRRGGHGPVWSSRLVSATTVPGSASGRRHVPRPGKSAPGRFRRGWTLRRLPVRGRRLPSLTTASPTVKACARRAVFARIFAFVNLQ